MKIAHVALWAADIERVCQFYETHFGATRGPQYVNAAKAFESYFLDFPGGGTRLEVMSKPGLAASGDERYGYAHLALSVGSVAQVDALTTRLRDSGVPVFDGPRWTGDGYYESVVLDPEGNRIEITV